MSDYVTDEEGRVDWSQSIGNCSSYNCIMGKPKGMHTNGPCAHIQLSHIEMRRLLTLMGKEIERLRKLEK